MGRRPGSGNAAKQQSQAKAQPKKQFPHLGDGVAFTKSITVSNGRMMGGTFSDAEKLLAGEKIDLREIPVKMVQGRTVRKDMQKDKDDSDEKVVSKTLYRAEEANLLDTDDTLFIDFEFGIRDATQQPHAISAEGFQKLRAMDFFGRIRSACGEIFSLFAENVFSGEWAWRNHDEADQQIIIVRDTNGKVYQDAVSLGVAISEAFLNNRPMHFHVTGAFRLGLGAQVYPSQLMDTQNKHRQYFQITTSKGQAPALRGVKIGNKLREMDTWYSAYEDWKIKLPVENLGYALWINLELRPKNSESLSHYLNEILGGNIAVLDDEKVLYFVTASTIFGFLATEGKDKDKKDEDKKDEEKAGSTDQPLQDDGQAGSQEEHTDSND